MGANGTDVVRALFERHNERDIDGFLALVRPDIEMATLGAGLEGRPYVGAAGVREYFDDMAAAWTEIRAEPDRIDDRGGDVLVIGRLVTRGRTSGISAETPVMWVFELEHGQVRRFEVRPQRHDTIQRDA